ncbi:BnaC02g36380D [Brassica napus]|uniref:BnaC02g36380D protein n=1 Tax=Brassica napus TaxID=3708 RepID=A0A078GTV6_BRANA|nr:BnaC02g36380D [Brassica napus]
MRVALDFHGVSGGSKSARQGLSRWGGASQEGSFDSVHFQIWVRFGGRATWCGSGELLLALSFAGSLVCSEEHLFD